MLIVTLGLDENTCPLARAYLQGITVGFSFEKKKKSYFQGNTVTEYIRAFVCRVTI